MTIEEEKKKIQSKKFVIEMLCGAAAALTYTDEEIYDTFCKEEAEEFIALRNEYMKGVDRECERMWGKPDADDEYPSIAAEDEAPYN